MNKILHILLAFFFSLTISSCGSDDGGSSASTDNSSSTTTSDDDTTTTTTTTDTTAPTVSSVSSSTTDGTYIYSHGDNITITVTFDETVVVDNSSGNPRIELETGSTDRYANYISGDSSSVLSFLYTIQSGDFSPDLAYKSTSSLSLNGGTIKDSSGNDATLTLPSPAASGSLSSNKALIVGGYVQEAYIKSINRPNTNMVFGGSVQIDNDTIAVGAAYEKSKQRTITNGPTAATDDTAYNGAVYIYTRDDDNSSWSQQAYIKPSNAQLTSSYFIGFGSMIVLDNNTLVVGASGDQSNQTSITNGTTSSTDTSASLAGAVFVYSRSGTDWSQQAYIKASNAEASDRFAQAVAFSGNTIVVGATHEASNQTTITNGTSSSSNNDNAGAGAVYVYTRSRTNWSQEAYIKASNSDASDYFGQSVSISGDTLAVGVPNEDSNQTTITTTSSSDNSAESSGAVHIFTRSGTTWSQEAYIKPSNAVSNMSFGQPVFIKGDLLVVGAGSEDSNATTNSYGSTASSDTSISNSGAVYVFERSGTSWSQKAYIKVVNPREDLNFPSSVHMDNTTIVAGSMWEKSSQQGITNGTSASTDNSQTMNGAAWVYRF